MSDLKQFWKSDLVSGFIVFLIALPLSLGIALASGVPPIAGLFAAMIGGLLVSRMSGSFVTVNGPAAGLIVVVLHGVETLGQGDAMQGYRSILLVTLASGLILFLAGKLKAGKLAELFPSSAVHGMLAAIGVIIISKQVHPALGVSPKGKSPFELIAEIPHSLMNLNPEVAVIGFFSIALLLILPRIPVRWVQLIPAPMAVVLCGIGLGHYFDLEHQHNYLFLSSHEYTIGPKFLVSLPDRIFDGITFPKFDAFHLPGFWSVLVSLTLVQGLETLISASAVDRFDPLKRKSDLDKDLAAVGFGTFVSGLIGGLPMIAEIVRSRANVSNGAKTSWANFFHGMFMLLFVALVPGLIHQIPLSALAAILIVTGFRLASPESFKHTLHIGWDQLGIFVTTLVMTLATDLLVGIFSGIIFKVMLHIVRGAPLVSLFKLNSWVEVTDEKVTLYLKNGVLFSSVISLKKQLSMLPKEKHVIIDFSHVTFIDHSTLEKIHDFVEDYKKSSGSITIVGLERLVASADHPLASRMKRA